VCHTMVYINTFVVDLSHMRSIKQLRDGHCVYGLYELSLYLLDDKFEVLETTRHLWVVHAQLVEKEKQI